MIEFSESIVKQFNKIKVLSQIILKKCSVFQFNNCIIKKVNTNCFQFYLTINKDAMKLNVSSGCSIEKHNIWMKLEI